MDCDKERPRAMGEARGGKLKDEERLREIN